MTDTAVGYITLELNGQDMADIAEFNVTRDVNNRPVATFNKSRRATMVAQGIKTFNITAQAAIPENRAEPDWDSLEDARITLRSEKGGVVETYTGVYIQQVGGMFTVQGEARRSLTLFALDYIKE